MRVGNIEMLYHNSVVGEDEPMKGVELSPLPIFKVLSRFDNSLWEGYYTASGAATAQ